MSEASAGVATLGAYFSLVKLLHMKKVIHIDELIATIGNTIDFANLNHLDNPTQKQTLLIYHSLQEIAQALARLDNK